jgi:hypothetical protein
VEYLVQNKHTSRYLCNRIRKSSGNVFELCKWKLLECFINRDQYINALNTISNCLVFLNPMILLD